MAVFKQCTCCGNMMHGGDGFYRKKGMVFCSQGCAEYALDVTPVEAENLYTELQHRIDDAILPHEQLLDDMAEFIATLAVSNSTAHELYVRYKQLYKI